MSCTDVGTIKYISDAGSNGWVGYTGDTQSSGYTNLNAGTWQEMPAADLDWDFAHAFNEACIVKDCTHEDILTCVAGALPPRPRLAHTLALPPTQPPSAHPAAPSHRQPRDRRRAGLWVQVHYQSRHPGATSPRDLPLEPLERPFTFP